MQKEINFLYYCPRNYCPQNGYINDTDYHLPIPLILKLNGIQAKKIKINEKITDIDFFYIVGLCKKNVLGCLNESIRLALKEKRCKIIFSHLNEYFSNNKNEFIKYTKLLQECGFNEANSFIIGCSGEKKISNVLTFNYFEVVVRHDYENNFKDDFKIAHSERIKNIQTFNFKKLFLCLNRKPRPHRTAFVYLCWKNELLSYIDCSLAPMKAFDFCKLKNKTRVMEICHLVSKNISTENLVKNILDFYQHGFFSVDGADLTKNLWSKHSTRFITDYGIHIVTETIIKYNNDVNVRNTYLTEKTFKPIAYKMPFIILGMPNTLKHLHALGYKTFNTLWDESYDDITDSRDRLNKVIELVTHLSKCEKSEMIKILNEAEKIANYNHQVFLKRRPEKILIEELLH